MRRDMNHAWIGVLESTPLGLVWLAVSPRGLVAVEIGEGDERRMANDEGALEMIELRAEAIVRTVRRLGFSQVIVDQERTGEALRQTAEYLQGERQGFELPI